MGKKISNQVRMIGVLPSEGADPIPVGKIPDDGTQIAVRGYVGAGTVEVHQVDGSKTLYLSAAVLSGFNIEAAGKYVSFAVTDGSDSLQYYIISHTMITASQFFLPLQWAPPLEINPGYKIKITASHANAPLNVFIHGYEV